MASFLFKTIKKERKHVFLRQFVVKKKADTKRKGERKGGAGVWGIPVKIASRRCLYASFSRQMAKSKKKLPHKYSFSFCVCEFAFVIDCLLQVLRGRNRRINGMVAETDVQATGCDPRRQLLIPPQSKCGNRSLHRGLAEAGKHSAITPLPSFSTPILPIEFLEGTNASLRNERNEKKPMESFFIPHFVFGAQNGEDGEEI